MALPAFTACIDFRLQYKPSRHIFMYCLENKSLNHRHLKSSMQYADEMSYFDYGRENFTVQGKNHIQAYLEYRAVVGPAADRPDHVFLSKEEYEPLRQQVVTPRRRFTLVYVKLMHSTRRSGKALLDQIQVQVRVAGIAS